MPEDRPLDRRTLVQAAGLNAFRAAAAVLDASRAIQAAGLRAALGIDEESIARAETPPESVAPSEARVGDSPYRVTGDGSLLVVDQTDTSGLRRELLCTDASELARMLRQHVVRDGPVLGPIAVHALAGTAAGLADHDAAARTNALRATGVILMGTRPASAALERALRRVEAVWLPLVAADGSAIVRALSALGEDLAAELDRTNAGLALRLAQRVVGAVRGERGVLMCGPFSAVATGTPSLALRLAHAIHAAGADPVYWSPEGRPGGEGRVATALELTQAGVRHRLIADTAVAAILASGRIGVVLVAAHRVTTERSVVAPMGSYSIAVMAALHQVPFVVAGPPIAIMDPPSPPETTPVWSVSAADRADEPWLELVAGVAPPVDETPAELVTDIVFSGGPG